MLLKSKFSHHKVAEDFLWSNHLAETFSQIMDFKVSVILGSPGYGKSSSVSYWLQFCLPELLNNKMVTSCSALLDSSDLNRVLKVAWLSLDQGENDLRRFWQYISGTLYHSGAYTQQQVRNDFINETEKPIKALITPLLNALDQPEKRSC